jgi:hypothetical protein
MKVKVNGNRTEQIKRGVEPWETSEIDIVLSDLTPEQRELLAENTTLTVVNADQAAVIEALQARIAERAAEAEAKAKDRRERDAAAIAECKSAQLTEGETTEHGVTYASYSAYPGAYICSYNVSAAVESLVEETKSRLHAEAAAKTAASRAAVADQIEAAKAESEAKAKVEAEAKQAEQRAKYAKRLETGIVEIPIERGNRKDWGEPWIAKLVSKNGRRPEYDFSAGSYDTATETLTIPCKPGEAIAYGQKNYRKPKRTIHEVRKMESDGRLVPA